MSDRVALYPLVKAYPVIDARTRSEAVCVAGVSADQPRRWIRLFPLDFRGLETEQRFKKYQRVELDVRPAMGDSRPESLTPVLASIVTGETIDTDRGTWRRRLGMVEPLIVASLCEIKRRQTHARISLGAFRPADVEDLVVSDVAPAKLAAKQDLLAQQSIFDERTRKLVVLPYRFRYRFRCSDAECTGHELSFIDWELGALSLRLLRGGADRATVVAGVRRRFLDEVCAPDRDVIFLVGNVAAHPASFLVLGVMWPPRAATAQQTLFGAG
jgi:hypothetical protein